MFKMKPIDFEFIMEEPNTFKGFAKYDVNGERIGYVYGRKVIVNFLPWKHGSMMDVTVYDMLCLEWGKKDVKIDCTTIYDEKISDVADQMNIQCLATGDIRGTLAENMCFNLFWKYCSDFCDKYFEEWTTERKKLLKTI